MRLEWINKYKHILILLLFSITFLAVRIPGLSTDIINPDAVNWHYRTQQFMNGIKYQQWEKTYQHYHPGVTLMWVTGVPLTIFMKLTGVKEYDMFNFETFDFVSKFSLTLVHLFLTLLLIFLLKKYLGFKNSVLIAVLISLEPFFLGNARLYHLDVLVALFTVNALFAGYMAIERRSYLYYIFAGFLFSMAVLTKSIAILAILFYGAWYLYQLIISKHPDYNLKYLIVVCLGFVLSCFVFFPALWVDPINYTLEVFSESERVGLRRGHTQVILGEELDSAGPFFYVIVALLRLSPFMLLGLVSYSLYWFKLNRGISVQISKGFSLYLAIFMLLYFVAVSLVSKKIDRYFVMLIPFLSIYAFCGLNIIHTLLKEKILLYVLWVFFIAMPLIIYYPYYFLYSSPMFGTPAQANSIIGFKPFGVGVHRLKERIIAGYGGYPSVGFIDTKPIKAIYPSSKVYDIRVNGPGDYDILVLGINEEFSEKVIDSEYEFKLVDTVEIAGLDYWRIYEKKR